MARKQDKQNQKRLVVNVHHVATPDAKERLSRAIDILLRAAARDTSQAEDSPDADKEKPSGRSTHKVAGDGECKDEHRRTLQD